MEKIALKAFAKLNLSLDITGLRADGYHLLDSIFQSIDIFDEITLVKKAEGISISSDNPNVPTDLSNTACKAAIHFFEKTKIVSGVDIHIKKNIPSEAGMGGGSADAAAVIVGLNELFSTGLSVKEMQDIGVLVGADVPFCIKGGSVRVKGIGEILEELPTINFLRFVVVMPKGKGISTKEAYKAYDKDGAKKHPDTEKLVSAIEKEDVFAFCENMHNVLEEVAPLDEIAKIEQKLLEYGADKAMMTGSGAAVFGVFHSLILALSAKARFKDDFYSFMAEPIPCGVKIISKE